MIDDPVKLNQKTGREIHGCMNITKIGIIRV